MPEVLLTRVLGRPESVLLMLETDSGLPRASCKKCLALFAVEDTGFVRCGSNFTLRKLKTLIRHAWRNILKLRN